MPRARIDYSLYYVTGRSLLPPAPTSYVGPPGDWYLAHLEQALAGGVTVVQVREKDVDGGEFYEVARRSKEVCDRVRPILSALPAVSRRRPSSGRGGADEDEGRASRAVWQDSRGRKWWLESSTARLRGAARAACRRGERPRRLRPAQLGRAVAALPRAQKPERHLADQTEHRVRALESGIADSVPSLAQYNVPLFVNDRLDIACLLKCHLHVGQSDLPARLARQLLGPDALLGVSVNTVDEMRTVLDEGVADYVGVGPCFGTQTKKNLNPIMGPRGVRAILEVLGDSEVKAVVIGASSPSPSRSFLHAATDTDELLVRAGGITPSTIPNVLAQTPAPLAGGAYRHLDGLAVVSSISAATDPFTAATELRALFLGRKMLPSWSTTAQAASLGEQQIVSNAADMLKLLREGAHKPLVHHITVRPFQLLACHFVNLYRRLWPILQNQVVMNDTANLTLAFGASPIMSSSPDEAPHLSKLISCLLLNLGTITEQQIAAQKIAGEAANLNQKPVVFDPVGVGATEYRKKSASGASRPLILTCSTCRPS